MSFNRRSFLLRDDEDPHNDESENRNDSKSRQNSRDFSMSLTDLLKDMERERDETESTECDLSDDGNENSLFSLSQLSVEKDADTNIGSTIQTEDLPSLSQSFERCNHMDNFRKSQGFHLDSTEKSRPKNPQGRKRVVRFASIPKLATSSTSS